MKKRDFLRILGDGMARLPYGEKEAALRYYEEYIEDAGPENEERVLKELGDPAILAHNIMRDSADIAREQAERERIQAEHEAPPSPPRHETEGYASKPLAPFHSIKTDILNAAVQIFKGSGYAVDIDYPEGYELPTCELRDDTLYIKDKKRPYTFLNIGSKPWRGGEIRITIPDGMEFDNFDLRTVNGSIIVPQVKLDNFKADTVNGSVKLSGVQAESLIADNVNGTVTAESCIATEMCKCSTVNGSVRVSGDIRGEVSYTSVNGSVRVSSPHSAQDFNFELSTVSGSVRINGEKMKKSTTIIRGAASTIHASTVNGSIGLDFEKA